MKIKIGDTVIPTAGPYIGLKATVIEYLDYGMVRVRFNALTCTCDGAKPIVGKYDVRWLRVVKNEA